MSQVKIKPIKIILRGMPQIDRVVEIIKMLPLEPTMEVTISKFKDTKSLAQLRTLHLWFNEIQVVFRESQSKFYTIDELKRWQKGLFGEVEILKLPDGKIITEFKSFADYKMAEMSKFMDKMNHYCGSELRIFLTIPGLDDQ